MTGRGKSVRPRLGRRAFEQRLVRFVNETLLADDPRRVVPETYLFEKGLINSMRILDLVAFVEQTLRIEIRLADVRMDRFRTPRAIAESFAAED